MSCLFFPIWLLETKGPMFVAQFGVGTLCMQKNIVFTMSSFQPSQISLIWYGMFSSLHVLLGVKGYKNSHDCLYFNVLPFAYQHNEC